MSDLSTRPWLTQYAPGVPWDVEPTDETLCDLLEIDSPASVDGRSMLPIIRDGAPGRAMLGFAYRHVQRALQAVRTGKPAGDRQRS